MKKSAGREAARYGSGSATNRRQRPNLPKLRRKSMQNFFASRAVWPLGKVWDFLYEADVRLNAGQFGWAPIAVCRD
jgi:hypothetical protein